MDLALLDLTSSAQDVFQQFSYLGPFLVLLLCGLGLPLPEEVSLIGSGLLLHQGKVEFLPITVVCSAAILLGDSLPFWLGRHYGESILRVRRIRRILNPERMVRLRRRFTEHGNWATFMCRFLPGVRIPGYFVAGTLHMGYLRFLLLDGLGVLVSVPLSIWIGKIFGDQIERLEASMSNLHLVLGFLVLAMALTFLLYSRAQRAGNRSRRQRSAPAQAPPTRRTQTRAVDDPADPE